MASDILYKFDLAFNIEKKKIPHKTVKTQAHDKSSIREYGSN